MSTIANATEITQLPAKPHRQQRATEPSITSAEDDYDSVFATDSHTEYEIQTTISPLAVHPLSKSVDTSTRASPNQETTHVSIATITTTATTVPSPNLAAQTALSITKPKPQASPSTSTTPFVIEPLPHLSSSSLVSPPRPRPYSFRNKIQISREEMQKYFYCPQVMAAKKLGVSLSTLKRRFYQLGIGRWPYHFVTQERRKRSIWHLVSEVEPKTEKELSSETVQTLTRLFSMSLQEQQKLAARNSSLSSSQRTVSINGDNEVTNCKFLHYVPRNELSPQSQTTQAGSTVSSNSSPVSHKRQRRFLLLDDGTNTNNDSSKGQKRLKLTGGNHNNSDQ